MFITAKRRIKMQRLLQPRMLPKHLNVKNKEKLLMNEEDKEELSLIRIRRRDARLSMKNEMK